jgi:Family of unknown function (DUF6464)
MKLTLHLNNWMQNRRITIEEEVMTFICDTTCKNNAHNPHVRCAVNPCGPCEGCPDYARASVGDQLKRRLWALDVRNAPAVKDVSLEIFLGALVGIQLGVLLTGLVIVPMLNTVIVTTHPCWPIIGVTQYCKK